MEHKIREGKGLVLFAKNHREKDKLVKIFTESYGKIMFFVKNAHRPNNPVASAILPFSEAVYIGDIRSEGLSFLNASKEVHHFVKIQQDIFINAYGTYILSLVDAAIEDREYDPALYGFTREALFFLNKGQDPEIITNIFEVQLLQRFGIDIDWKCCRICGETQGKFDYSSKYHGVLCEKHWFEDPRRYHSTPKAIHFIRLFSQIQYDQIDSITLKAETKNEIRETIDQLYEEYVGIHLKSKKFIDNMKNWEQSLKLPKPKEK